MQYSNETNQLLISLYNGSSVTVEQFENYAFRSLIQENFIHRSSTYGDPYVYLSDAGKAYVESLLQAKDDKKYSRFRDNVNLFLAIFGIVLSIIAIIISIVKP